MIKIIEVKSKKEQKAFVKFPIYLYRDCQFYVPSFEIAEYNIFSNDEVNDDCKYIFYLAIKNDVVVGRIGAILQNTYNEKTAQQNVRFTRFDCINNVTVAKMLFESVEKWAIINGMNNVNGPMGFNNLEKVGVQINGFDQMGNLVALYNFPYYYKLLEKCGYKKATKYVEYSIEVPKHFNNINEINNYKVVQCKNVNKLVKKYKSKIFNLINEFYNNIYGGFPISPIIKEKLLCEYKFLINSDFVAIIENSNKNIVGFGFAIPGLAKEMNVAKGKIVGFETFKMIKTFIKPNYAEILFICIDENENRFDIQKLICNKLVKGLIKHNIKYVESNPILYGGYGNEILQGFNYVKRKERVIYNKILNNNSKQG